jgi:type IV secretion system protein VirB4
VPYVAQLSPFVIKSVYGDYLQAFRLAGASFETSDDRQLNSWHERINVLWRNVASPNVAIWTHVVRRSDDSESSANRRDTAGCAVNPFTDELASKYGKRLQAQKLMVNDIYLSILYRPTSSRAAGFLAKLLAARRNSSDRDGIEEALDASEKLSQTILASLARYEPERLGIYDRQGRPHSALFEYLGLLVNGEGRPLPLLRRPLAGATVSSRVLFGNETIEYRTPSETRYGAILGIKEYPTPSVVGMYDRLLSAPFPFVLTQSFAFLSKPAAQTLLQRQFNRMANAGDFAISQARELTSALDSLTSNDFVMGDHHFSLQILTQFAPAGSHERDAAMLRELNDHVALARAQLADTGMIVAREDLGLEAAFWAQLPGCFPMRPRKAPITSRNFAAMAPFHNFPTGKAQGNHWGDALTTLTTTARSAYHFSLHASDPSESDGGARKDTGHTLICGPTGSGKTVLVGFLIAMLCRQNATQVIFDKDRGLEILVKALGGEYLALKNGAATGFNPLQLPPSPTNVEFLKSWLQSLCWGPVPPEREPTGRVREQADLEQALRGTLALEIGARRLSRLIEFLDPTSEDGPYRRLKRWCRACSGDYAWAFDNPVDVVLPRMGARNVIGFDVTEFLENPQIRAPITLYLFHLVRQLLDGRRLVCWMDEFWRLVADPAFESFAKDGPKTWRKLNAVMCLATQSASDVLGSPISRTLVEQTPTKVFFPNSDADYGEFGAGFGLTEREFNLVRTQMDPGSRSFLVKQGAHSVVCQLNLKGYDGELAVMSGRPDSRRRMNEIIERTGSNPVDWLQEFFATK